MGEDEARADPVRFLLERGANSDSACPNTMAVTWEQWCDMFPRDFDTQYQVIPDFLLE